MNKIFFRLIAIAIFLTACDSDDLITPSTSQKQEDNDNTEIANPLPVPTDKTALVFYDNLTKKSAHYQAVRIGEYLWMNSNINHHVSTSFNRADIDRILHIYKLDPAKYPTKVEDINKYCGPYYDRFQFEYLEDKMRCVIYEGEKKILQKGWGAPSTTDFKQLFAMCGNGTEHDIRITLACRPGDTPAAIGDFTYWINSQNTNRYGFNLMPGGARINGNDTWRICHNDQGDCEDILMKKGDFYGFFEATTWVTWDGTVAIDDYPHFNYQKSWHWLPIRWCRMLTNEELGYKLYINNEQTEIKKLTLTQNPPSGYTELEKGYIRGFYVQYILDNPNPTKTVTDIVKMSKNLR